MKYFVDKILKVCNNFNMKNKKKIDARFPVSLAFKKEMYSRLEKLRNDGWKISEIFVAGIEICEKRKK